MPNPAIRSLEFHQNYMQTWQKNRPPWLTFWPRFDFRFICAVIQMASEMAGRYKIMFFLNRFMNLIFIFQKAGEPVIAEGHWLEGIWYIKLRYFPQYWIFYMVGFILDLHWIYVVQRHVLSLILPAMHWHFNICWDYVPDICDRDRIDVSQVGYIHTSHGRRIATQGVKIIYDIINSENGSLAQSCSLWVEPSIAFATGPSSTHQRVMWPAL